MGDFLNIDQINDGVRKINITNCEYSQWIQKRAQKRHIDLFGKEILEGDDYFRLRVDQNLSNDLKLSLHSMERFLFAIFAAFPKWEHGADKELKERNNEILGIIDKLRNH